MRKLVPCSKELCIHTFEEYFTNVLWQIKKKPEIAAFNIHLADMTCVACSKQAMAASVFEPFPASFLIENELRARAGVFDGGGSRGKDNVLGSPSKDNNKNWNRMNDCIAMMPSVDDILETCSDEKDLRNYLNDIQRAGQFRSTKGMIKSKEEPPKPEFGTQTLDDSDRKAREARAKKIKELKQQVDARTQHWSPGLMYKFLQLGR